MTMVIRSQPSRSNVPADSTSSAGHNQRPKSSHSTTSTISNTTQPTQPHAPDSSHPTQAHLNPVVWQITNGLPNQSSYSMAPSSNHFPVDANTQQHAHMSFGPGIGFPPNNTPRMQSPAQWPSIEGRENSILEIGADGQVPVQKENVADGSRRKKGSASSQANDNELRRLFRENQGRELHDVALQIVKDEKGPRSEKAKQIFGMLWISHNIKRSNGSVTRNRVHGSYTKCCGTERVPPLNPASFGKLLRIIFPGIQTRRLGVRGESKYHYVELSLVFDDGEPERPSMSRMQSMGRESTSHRESVKPASSKPQLPADTASFSPAASPQPATRRNPRPNMVSGSLYLHAVDWNNHHTPDPAPNMIPRPLKFPTSSTPPQQGEIQLELPSIEPYLPPGTDIDAVNSLVSVYRSHCHLAIDNFRFCKTDKFCDSYKSLAGLLTMPGQKLLAHPKIAGWIRECDWLKYQKMVPMLDFTLLNQMPRKAMAHMEQVALSLCGWIAQFFQNQPEHVLDAMQGPASIFVTLVQRYLRVNRAALDVAGVLESVVNRDKMWCDWAAHIQPFHVLQNSLFSHGHKRVLHILTQDIRLLLSPLHADLLVGGGRVFEDSETLSDFQRKESDMEIDNSSSSIIGRMFRFIESLPSRFPSVDARSLLSHIDVIGSNASRNMTLGGAESLGHWWRVKLFIDESSYWLAEKGGFVETGPGGDGTKLDFYFRSAFDRVNGGYGFEGNRGSFSRPRTGVSTNTEHDMDDSFTMATKVASLPHGHGSTEPSQYNLGRHSTAPPGLKLEEGITGSRGQSTVLGDEGPLNPLHDDSGVGLGMDDDFNVDGKYHSFVEGVHGSDPADVVVC